jgi:hypothetical protein
MNLIITNTIRAFNPSTFLSSLYIVEFITGFRSLWLATNYGKKSLILFDGIAFLIDAILNKPAQNVAVLIIGCILLSVDITLATTTCRQYCANYRNILCTIVKRILKYLRGTIDYALCYSTGKIPHELQAYADANYGGDLNDRRSRTGVTITLNSRPIIWICRKQKCVVTSTTKSEYVVASTANREAL